MRSAPSSSVTLASAAIGMAVALSSVETDARADDDPWLGRDKLLHFGASAAIAGGGYALGTALDERRTVAFALGGGLALAAGVGKEALDAAGLGDPSFRDLAWDVAGTLVGLGIAFGVDVLVRREPSPASAAASPLVIRF